MSKAFGTNTTKSAPRVYGKPMPIPKDMLPPPKPKGPRAVLQRKPRQGMYETGPSPTAGKRRIAPDHIYLFKSQIIYDIEAQISMMAKARRDDSGNDPSFADTEDYADMLNGWIERYAALAKGRLQAFIVNEKRPTETTNIKDTSDEITFHLTFPPYYDTEAFEPLKQAIHDYIVDGTLYEYLTMMIPNDAVIPVIGQRREDDFNNIKRFSCTTLAGHVHRGMHPFP